jgi:hypothetical protein
MSRQGGWGCAFSFLAAVALLGLGSAWSISGHPGLHVLAARSWPVHSCLVGESRPDSSYGRQSPRNPGSGPHYSSYVRYTYTVNDRAYESTRYDFWGNIDSAREHQLLLHHQAGSQIDCYVNPTHPEEAVLSREWTGIGLAPLFPLAIGIAGTIGFVKLLRLYQMTGGVMGLRRQRTWTMKGEDGPP